MKCKFAIVAFEESFIARCTVLVVFFANIYDTIYWILAVLDTLCVFCDKLIILFYALENVIPWPLFH